MYTLHRIVWIKPKHVVTAITFLIYAGKLRLNLLRLKKSCAQKNCVKSVQIRSFFWSVFSLNTGKYEPEKTPYLDTFHAVTNCAIAQT